MNVQEYIASGILEQYVLGLLSEEEHQKVLQNAQQYPAIQAEIDAFEDALLKYAQANAIPLRPGLSTQILNAIDALILKTFSFGKATTSSFNWMSGLLGTLLLATIGFVFYGIQERNNLEQALSASQRSLETLQRDYDLSNLKLEQCNTQLNILRSICANTTTMRPQKEEDNQFIAQIHKDSNGKIAYLDVARLDEPPAGKQYQLWYIADSAPQSMGVFDVSDDFIPVDFVANATIFAISLEDEGGSPQPTDIRFLGKVS